MLEKSSPVNDETQEQSELQPIHVKGHLNIISVQLVPAASVVAEPVAENQSGQADRHLDTISVQSVSANDETQKHKSNQNFNQFKRKDIPTQFQCN